MLTLKTEFRVTAEWHWNGPLGMPPERLARLIAPHPEVANGQIAVELPDLCGEPVPDYRRPMRLCLYQPEIAGNVGAVMRLGACFGVPVDLIEPMGFTWDDRRVRRTAMDYIDHVDVQRHPSFDAYRQAVTGRLILFTTKAERSVYDFIFQPGDILLFGKESGGVPAEITAKSDARLRIPIRAEVRSFNLATSAAIALGEALRQTQGLPA